MHTIGAKGLTGKWIFKGCNVALLVLVGIVTLYPFWWVFISSFTLRLIDQVSSEEQ